VDPAQNTEPNTGNLRPAWKKGQSGNPGGRPKGLARAVRDIPLEKADTPGDLVLARFWWSVLLDETADMAHRMQASKLLADRGWGKAAEYVPIEESDPLGVTEDQVNAMADELDRRLDELAARRASR
jgi:hypothetical protein